MSPSLTLRLPVWVILAAVAGVGLLAWTTFDPPTPSPSSGDSPKALESETTPLSPATSEPRPTQTSSESVNELPAHQLLVSLPRQPSILLVEGEVEARWRLDAPLRYMDATDDGSLTLATSAATDTLYALNGATGEVRSRVGVGDDPQGVRIGPNATRALVVNRASNTVTVVPISDGTIQTPTEHIRVGQSPQSVAFAPDGRRAYVTVSGENRVAVLDLAHMGVDTTIPVSGTPHGIAVAPDGGRLYVTARKRGDVAVVDMERGAVIWHVVVGDNPLAVAGAPDGERVYASSLASNRLDIIDVATLDAPRTIGVGDGPHSLAFGPGGRYPYVVVTRAAALAVLDTESLDVAERIPLAAKPFWLQVLEGR